MTRSSRFVAASLGAVLLVAPAAGHCEERAQTSEITANGNGFLFLRGNRMSPPWRLSIVGTTLAVNDSVVATRIDQETSRETKLVHLAGLLSDSLSRRGTPPAEVAKVLLSFYRKNGFPSATVTLEERDMSRVVGVPAGSPPPPPSRKVAVVRLPRGRKWEFSVERSVINELPPPSMERLMPMLEPMARVLNSGGGILARDLGIMTLIPGTHVKLFAEEIARLQSGRLRNTDTLSTILRPYKADILSPARLERVARVPERK